VLIDGATLFSACEPLLITLQQTPTNLGHQCLDPACPDARWAGSQVGSQEGRLCQLGPTGIGNLEWPRERIRKASEGPGNKESSRAHTRVGGKEDQDSDREGSRREAARTQQFTSDNKDSVYLGCKRKAKVS
jgi:hypothetical protein